MSAYVTFLIKWITIQIGFLHSQISVMRILKQVIVVYIYLFIGINIKLLANLASVPDCVNFSPRIYPA